MLQIELFLLFLSFLFSWNCSKQNNCPCLNSLNVSISFCNFEKHWKEASTTNTEKKLFCFCLCWLFCVCLSVCFCLLIVVHFNWSLSLGLWVQFFLFSYYFSVTKMSFLEKSFSLLFFVGGAFSDLTIHPDDQSRMSFKTPMLSDEEVHSWYTWCVFRVKRVLTTL